MDGFFKIFLSILILVTSCNVLSVPVSEIVNTGETARIVNGHEVDITEVPYQASLKRHVISGWAHICGAVVIYNRGVLTAGHCVENYVDQPSNLQVVVGTAYRRSGGEAYELASIALHEKYVATTAENDIAIMFTARDIIFSPTVMPIAIADESFLISSGETALVSGFGTLSYQGASSDKLMAARVNIVAQTTCARAYLRIASITRGMLCANASNPPRDACQGDSGGPLVARNHLIGVVSWGEGCAESAYPGVYTRISEYYRWIMQQIAKKN